MVAAAAALPGQRLDSPLDGELGREVDGDATTAGVGTLEVGNGADAERDIEGQCAALARSAGPLRRVLAALAGRLRATRGWERLGYARAGDYTREHLGFSARELDDLARVDTALRALPRLEAALVSGGLPWTKVRLLARAAQAHDEAAWIAFARRIPARQLAQHVRAVDTGSVEAGAADADPDDAGRREGICLKLRPEVQAKWQIGWRLVRRVAGEALDVGSCAEWIAAEVLSGMPVAQVPVLEDGSGEEGPPPGMDDRTRRGLRVRQRVAATARAARLADVFERSAREAAEETPGPDAAPAPLPDFLRALADGLEEADPRALDARLRRAVALAQRLEADLAPWLRRVADARLYRRCGHAGLESYARERLGIGARKAWALLRLERSACPALRAAFREGRLSWVQAQALLPIVARTPAHAAAWIALAGCVTVRRLRDDVDRAALLADTDPDAFARSGGVPDLEAEARGESGLQTGAKSTAPERPAPETSRAFFTAPRDVARLFRATLCTVRRLLGSGATVSDGLDAMLEHCFHAWGVYDRRQQRLRRGRYRIYDRDGWRCAVPGCTSYRNLHAHHKHYRSRGGGDEDANLLTLCAWHHLRAEHQDGVLRIRGRMPDEAVFELPLGTYRSGDVRMWSRAACR